MPSARNDYRCRDMALVADRFHVIAAGNRIKPGARDERGEPLARSGDVVVAADGDENRGPDRGDFVLAEGSPGTGDAGGERLAVVAGVVGERAKAIALASVIAFGLSAQQCFANQRPIPGLLDHVPAIAGKDDTADALADGEIAIAAQMRAPIE